MVSPLTVTGKRILDTSAYISYDIPSTMEHPWNPKSKASSVSFKDAMKPTSRGKHRCQTESCPVTTLGSKPLETSLETSGHITIMIHHAHHRSCFQMFVGNIMMLPHSKLLFSGLRRTCLVSFKDAIKPIPFPVGAGSSLTCKEDVKR